MHHRPPPPPPSPPCSPPENMRQASLAVVLSARPRRVPRRGCYRRTERHCTIREGEVARLRWAVQRLSAFRASAWGSCPSSPRHPMTYHPSPRLRRPVATACSAVGCSPEGSTPRAWRGAVQSSRRVWRRNQQQWAQALPAPPSQQLHSLHAARRTISDAQTRARKGHAPSLA